MKTLLQNTLTLGAALSALTFSIPVSASNLAIVRPASPDLILKSSIESFGQHKLTVSNQGGIGAGPFNVLLMIDGVPTILSVDGLKAGASKVIAGLHVGPYCMTAMADVDNQVIEKNEANNGWSDLPQPLCGGG